MRKTPLMLLVQARNGDKPVEDILRKHYVEERRTDREIAEALGVDRGVIQQWRQRFGIRRADDPMPLEPVA